MAWDSPESFKKAARFHFILSLLLMVFSGVGLKHTMNTDWDGSAPYWAFGAVGGIMQFLCTCCAASIYKKRSSWAGMAKAIGIYRLLLLILLIWGFVGTLGTAVTGACADLAECPYQENQSINKGMAICILLLHIVTFISTVVISEDTKGFYLKGGTSITRAPKPATAITRPYDPSSLTSRNNEPSPYNTPLPTTYNILPPPSGTLPPPPSYDEIMSGSHPSAGIEPTIPRSHRD